MTKRKQHLWQEPLTEEKVWEIAHSLAFGRRWRYVPPADYGESLPLVIGALNEVYKKDLKYLGAILGNREHCVGRLSGQKLLYGEVLLVHRDDWQRITTLVATLQEAVSRVMGGRRPLASQ